MTAERAGTKANRQAAHQIAHIDQPDGLDQGRRHGEAGRGPLERPGLPARLRIRQAGRHQADDLPLSPVAHHRPVPPHQCGARTPIRGAVQDEALGPAGMGGGERDRGPPAVGQPEPHCARRLRSGHDRRHVPNPLLGRRQPGDRVRQAGAALVQPDQPTASLQRPNETAVPGLLPLDVQMGDQAVHHDQVRRPGA